MMLTLIIFILLSCFQKVQSKSEIDEMKILREQMFRLEKIVTSHEVRINDLENVVQDQNSEIKYLKLELGRFKSKVNILKGSRLKAIVSSDDDLQKVEAKMTDSLKVGNRETRILRTTNTSQAVAFYAYLSTFMPSPGSQEILAFDNFQINAGNGYNKHSGIFKAPVSGIYVFTSSIAMDGNNKLASFQFVKNAGVVGAFFVDTQFDNGIHFSSTTIVISLNPGDFVYVRTGSRYTAHGTIISDVDTRSSFSGWKIY